MRLIGNGLNNDFFVNLLKEADNARLRRVRMAVAYSNSIDPLIALARARDVPILLYTLFDGYGFPSPSIFQHFLRTGRRSWQLFLTAKHFHPKIYWFEGVGAYVGSANLTDSGWTRNLECGVWFTDSELVEQGFDVEFDAMLRVIAGRCVAASLEHADLAKRLSTSRRELARAEREFEAEVGQALRNIPGRDPPIVVGSGADPGGEARRSFVREWHATLTILRGVTAMTAQEVWPSWIDKSVPPAIVQDQATEYWYQRHIRSTRDSDVEVERLHSQNVGRTESTLKEVFKLWRTTDEVAAWAEWINVYAGEARELLRRDALALLDAERLAKVLWIAHSAREHARQIRNDHLGLAPGTHLEKAERCEIWAAVLMGQRTSTERGVAQVLDHVLWDDASTPDCADRIWDAAREPAWRLPHLGPNILGELVGLARPDEYPPRNNRVSRTLHALGFEGIAMW